MGSHKDFGAARVLAAVGVVGLVVGTAAGQTTSPVRTSSRGGLMGVPARLPNVLGQNRSLPLQRRITLPGLQPAPSAAPSAPSGYSGGLGYGGSAVVGGRGYCFDGGGLTVNGRHVDDNWKLAFHLGSPDICYPYDRPVYSHYYPTWGYYGPWWYRNYGSYYYNAPVDGSYYRLDATLQYPQLAQAPAQQPAPEPDKELKTIERARLLMAADMLDESIEQFRAHLAEDPEDVEAMRSQGFAMIEAGRMDDGVAMVALAYRTDPVLARTPFDIDELGVRRRRYDMLLSSVLQFARKTDSGSGHLAAVVLLQADGKVSGAARVLDRAEKAGLGAEIVNAFRRELGRPATN